MNLKATKDDFLQDCQKALDTLAQGYSYNLPTMKRMSASDLEKLAIMLAHIDDRLKAAQVPL